MLKDKKSVAILSRTHWIHGLESKEFRAELIKLMGNHWRKSYEGRLQVNTMHAHKGLEADLVILTDITDGRMPLIHQDTMLYAPLLPPNVNPLEEARIDERRLFYVALTRAKETLWILTESRLGSEFVKELSLTPLEPAAIPPIAD
jgi:DNA helicase-4